MCSCTCRTKKKRFKPMTGPSKEHFLLPTPSQHPCLITTPPGPALGLPHSLYGCRYTTIYSTDQRLPIVWEGILKGTLSLGIWVNKHQFHLRNDTWWLTISTNMFTWADTFWKCTFYLLLKEIKITTHTTSDLLNIFFKSLFSLSSLFWVYFLIRLIRALTVSL